MPVPTREDDGRQTFANPYYAQHDHVSSRQGGARWSWSSTRPCNIHGFSIGYPHNAVLLIGAYAALARDAGLPFSFPGTHAGFSLPHCTIDARLLCKAAVWIAENAACANEDFNVANGDVFSWQGAWHRIAEFFDMPVEPVKTVKLAQVMAGKSGPWKSIQARHRLRAFALEELVGCRRRQPIMITRCEQSYLDRLVPELRPVSPAFCSRKAAPLVISNVSHPSVRPPP